MGSNESLIKGGQAIKYYPNLTSAATMIFANSKGKELKEKVMISIRLQNIIDDFSYHYEAIDISVSPERILKTSSEQKSDNGIIMFNDTFLMDYYFEKNQKLMFNIFKNNGTKQEKVIINTTLGCIVGGRDNILKKKLDNFNNEEILISAVSMTNSNEYLDIEFDIEPIGDWNFMKEKNQIYYLVTANTNLYQSETISSTGKFKNGHIPTSLLKNDFKITLYNAQKKEISSIHTNLNQFLDKREGSPLLNFTINMSKKRTAIFHNKSLIRKSVSFFDYLQSGIQIGLNIGIDFTGSNGHPLDDISLHNCKTSALNHYEQVILSCGTILAYYDFDQMFPVYGFGAVLPQDTKTSMCFPISLNNNPEIYLIEGVLNQYRQIVCSLTFSGPTFFAPIIQQVMKNVIEDTQKNKILKYTVLLILTDGIINDMQDTINSICECAHYPMSIIIIGIGKEDFTNMEILDADKEPLISRSGEKCIRDIVQFVPFEKVNNNAERLAEEVLAELPKQVVEYYTMNQIFPPGPNNSPIN